MDTPTQAVSDIRPPRRAVENAWRRARQALIAEQTLQGHWIGQLSTSALSTATAVSALALVRKQNTSTYLSRREEIDSAISVACHWLLRSQNADGGFGDTNLSHSNIATSLLVLAAWQLAQFHEPAHLAVSRGWKYCDRTGKWDALRRRYGIDKTFVAPILANCALAGIVPWDDVPTLPFEAAWLPQNWYRLARMPVVSYAIPALVAIGQAKFHHRPQTGPLGRLRRAAIEPTLRVLNRMQPQSGGYLEAVPLTSFVLMSLADIGRSDHPVAVRAVDFLLSSRLSDGSLPIDTNLATWTTSLATSALEYYPTANEPSGKPITPTIVRWLLSCQHWSPHPFTGARPGGWGWSNLSGAVPDADDTPAALIGLARWLSTSRGRFPMLEVQIAYAAEQGLRWLIQLQNRDGGWPTFCRGWGTLPFDRSGSDLTAHVLRALNYWRKNSDWLPNHGSRSLLQSMDRAIRTGFNFLEKSQNGDGSWFPLWFGNQDRDDEENPVYGTSKVLLAYADLRNYDAVYRRGTQYLLDQQNRDGGWGGGISVPYRIAGGLSEHGSSVEETAAALEALVVCTSSTLSCVPTIMRGLRWLIAAVDESCFLTSWPIGFYFAKLWYHERLYPIIASTAALGAALERTELWFESP